MDVIKKNSLSERALLNGYNSTTEDPRETPDKEDPRETPDKGDTKRERNRGSKARLNNKGERGSP
jgi:hypothetical protein